MIDYTKLQPFVVVMPVADFLLGKVVYLAGVVLSEDEDSALVEARERWLSEGEIRVVPWCEASPQSRLAAIDQDRRMDFLN